MTASRILRVAFVVGCLTSLVLSAPDELAQKLIEHVLRIPNPDKVLNTVIGRLEMSKETTENTSPTQFQPEYTEALETSHEREQRQLGSQKHYPICHLERRIHKLNTDDYEYRPAYYEEVRCTSVSREEDTHDICSSLGFSCVQWNKTIHLTRRLYTSDCWESRTMLIQAGCECMWPVYRLGDMSLHVGTP